MKFVLKSSNHVLKLIELFKLIKSLNTFCTMYCNESKIFIQTMDDSHIALLDININKDWFDDYDCTTETISFNTSIITNILNLYTPNGIITFNTSDNSDYLSISLLSKDNNEKRFDIPLVDIDTDLLKSSELDYGLELSIPTKNFDKIISEHLLFGDSVEIVYNNNNFYMKSIGDLGEYKLKIPKENLNIIKSEDNSKLYNKISLKFLSYITKIYSVFKHINIKMSNEEGNPLTLESTEEDDELLKIIYYIAPKIQDDDEEFEFSEFTY